MHIALSIYPEEDEGSDMFVARIIPVQDIILVEAVPSDPNRCYIFLSDLPEKPLDQESICCVADHSFEELAHALGCDTEHMKGKFERKAAPKLSRGSSPAP